MNHLKRNWKLFAVTCALIVTTGAWWWMGTSATAQAPEPLFSQVTEQDRDELSSILTHVDLDLSALAALNISDQQAIDVMSTARTWWESNGSALDSLASTVATKRAALEDLEKSRRLGGQGASSVEDVDTARADLATANAAYDAAFKPLRAVLSAQLSGTQISTWRTLANGWGRQLPVRMLDLTAQQRHDYAKAKRVYRLQMAAASDAQSRNDALARFQQSLAVILTPDNQAVLDSYMGYIADSSQAVQNAMDTVMPTSNPA